MFGGASAWLVDARGLKLRSARFVLNSEGAKLIEAPKSITAFRKLGCGLRVSDCCFSSMIAFSERNENVGDRR